MDASLLVGIAALFIGVAAVSLPFAYPDKSKTFHRVILFSGLAVSFALVVTAILISAPRHDKRSGASPSLSLAATQVTPKMPDLPAVQSKSPLADSIQRPAKLPANGVPPIAASPVQTFPRAEPAVDTGGAINVAEDNLMVGSKPPLVKNGTNIYRHNTVIMAEPPEGMFPNLDKDRERQQHVLERRRAVVLEMRRLYLAVHPDVADKPDYLPPDDYMNAYLAEKKAAWRVRSRDGGVEAYDLPIVPPTH